MKILHAVSGWPPERSGATERYVQRLAQAQSEAGHEVAVAAGTPTGRFEGGFSSPGDGGQGVVVHRISQPGGFDRWDQGSSPSVARCFGGLLDATRPDVVHVHQWAGLSRALVRRSSRSGIPGVVTLHDFAASCPRTDRVREAEAFCQEPLSVKSCLKCVPREKWVADRLVAERIGQYTADMLGELEAAAALVVASRAQAREVARFSGLPATRLQVVEHPPAFESGDPVAGDRGATLGRPLRVAFWGPSLGHAGAQVVIEALQVLARPAELELIVLAPPGDPSIESALEALGAQLAVKRLQTSDAASVRNAEADVGLICGASFEGHGHALDEAFAAAMPVLVSDRGAQADRVRGGGLAFPPGDASALAHLLGRVLDQPDLLGSLRAEVPELVAMGDHLAELEAVYEGVIKSGPRHPSVSPGEMDDRERWERLSRALEDQGRDLAGLQGSAEGEVRGLRRDVSDIFGRLQGELAQGAGRLADVEDLKARIAVRMSDLEALETRLEAVNRRHEEREALSREELDRKAEELDRKAEELALLRATEEGLRAQAVRMRREALLALPLILPARGLLWLADRLKGLARGDRPGEDGP